MEKKRIVVALGGNALSKDGRAQARDQLAVATETAKQLMPIIEAGHDLAIVHGNGPQVGNIIVKEESVNTAKEPTMPIDVCGAMSQGQIGYWLQNALHNSVARAGLPMRSIASVVTQVVVDKNDPAFDNPTKPIGAFFTSEEEAKTVAEERGFVVKEDAGRGWRRVVPSPRPIDIVEASLVKSALDQGSIVISTGGGGIPVRRLPDGQLIGLEAVIDKDFAAEKLAELIGADTLLILTAIEAVKINFRQENEQSLDRISVAELKQHVADNQFAAGSMLPKIEASIQFLEFNPSGSVIITTPEMANLALQGQAGTTILG
ncbi:MAG: carbamate kinase [Candidatus Nanosyncoccaceae bacterium]|jgi:carbamate kinase